MKLADGDLLFHFMDSLENSAKQKVQHQGVKMVDKTVAMAKSLTGFQGKRDASKGKVRLTDPLAWKKKLWTRKLISWPNGEG